MRSARFDVFNAYVELFLNDMDVLAVGFIESVYWKRICCKMLALFVLRFILLEYTCNLASGHFHKNLN